MRYALLALLCTTTAATAATPEDYGAPEPGSVRIVRDAYGVPHIIARDNASLHYGVGYAQAEDQLENLVKNFMRGEGRVAEIEGASEVAFDHIVRMLEVPRRAREVYARVDAATREQLDSFAAGVNAYMAEHRDEVPDWIQPVEPHQVIGFSMFIDTMFSVSHCRRDLQRAGIRLAMLDAVEARAGSDFGSNQFAISPDRSASGACMLSMDPHLPHSSFYRWYEMHVVGPEINAMGACFFGSPYVTMGRTERTAWCMTVNGPDLGDVFVVNVDPDDPTRYKDVDGWKTFTESTETYRVATPLGKISRERAIKRTELGPVAAEKDGKAYVFALPTSDTAERARQIYEMCRAQSVDAFRRALEPLGLVMFNIVYADADGDIFYISNGRVPRRDVRIDSSEARPGDQAWARWQGIHPLAELPQTLNPPGGYLLNCNSGPQNVTPEAAPRPDDFPPYMMSQRANSRWRRLSALLAADASITWDEMRTYATDTQMEAAAEHVPAIVSALRQKADSDGDALCRRAAEVLEAWDRRADVDSRGAVLFFHLYTDGDFVRAVREGDAAAMGKRGREIAAGVQQTFNRLDAPWGEFSRIRRGDRELPIAGSGGSNAIGAALRPTYGRVEDGRRYCTGGSSYGMIVDFAGATRAVSCLPYGVSEDPTSPHFADQMPLYAQRQFKPDWFRPDEIAANTESNHVLQVAK